VVESEFFDANGPQPVTRLPGTRLRLLVASGKVGAVRRPAQRRAADAASCRADLRASERTCGGAASGGIRTGGMRPARHIERRDWDRLRRLLHPKSTGRRRWRSTSTVRPR
jgi:hypothetical protein